MDHSDFFEELVSEANVSKEHPIVKYLFKKTLAVDRGSKARRSLGNLYAIQVLAEDYVNRLEVSSFLHIFLKAFKLTVLNVLKIKKRWESFEKIRRAFIFLL